MAERNIVFIGPSRPPGFVPPENVELRPPARRGDVARAVQDGAQRIGLIDGELIQSLAVTPAEVRAACGAAQVLGAASMGALRAVEVPEVRGIGCIFEAFRDGTLCDDDELVGTWDPDTGRTIAWPLVIVRDAAARTGLEHLIPRWKALPISDRTGSGLALIVRRSGAEPAAFLEALRREPNVKQRDAAALLSVLTRNEAKGW